MRAGADPSARELPVAAMLFIAFAVTTGCGRETVAAARAAAIAVPSVMAETATVTAPVTLAAQLYVEHDAVVAARGGGMLERLTVDLGTRVAEGERIGELESAGQAIALDQATSVYENAARAVQRARMLVKANGLTQSELEQLELSHRQADLSVRKARRDLELTRVVAPFAGIVTARFVRAPRLVSAGDSLVRIAEMTPLLARVRVPERAAGSVRLGDAAMVVVLGGGAVTASVIRLAPAFDPGSGTREVVLRVDGSARLLPGASVEVRLGHQQRRVIVIPRSAVSADGYVIVVEHDRTSMRAVTLGEDLEDGRVEIATGLAAGERVLRSPRQ
jgi:RND family efflux transporter MFP subunit